MRLRDVMTATCAVQSRLSTPSPPHYGEVPCLRCSRTLASVNMVKRGRICQTCLDSRTPALSAAMSGHRQCLEEAYRSLKVLNERDRFGATPIHYAARHGQLDCLRWLVENSGVSPNGAARNGSTPAHDAAATGYLECLKYLLINTKCSVNDRTVEGATVLHMACRFGREDEVRWLIEYGNASPSDKGANGVTPVHLCAAKNALSCLQWLTIHPKYVPNQLTAHGATPAYFAAQEGSLECLHWIVVQGEGNVSLCAKDGMYPIHASAQAGQLGCLQFLIDECKVPVRTRSNDGATVAHFSAAGGHIECLRWLLNLDEGLAMVRDHLGGMPMHDAAEEGQYVSLEEFIRRGIDIEAKDYDGVTPLELTEEHNHEDCMALLRAAKEQMKNAPESLPPAVTDEAEEELKRKELEEQQRRHLAAALIQEEEQKIEIWRKQQEQRPSLGEQLEKLKEAQKAEAGERYQEPVAALPSGTDLSSPGDFPTATTTSAIAQSVTVSLQQDESISQTEITVRETVALKNDDGGDDDGPLYEDVSEMAVVTASTADLDVSEEASPEAAVRSLPNGHAPSPPLQSTKPADTFSDAEDEYRRGASGRHRRSLLQLLRIKVKAKTGNKKEEKKKKKKKKKKKDQAMKGAGSSDSDLEISSLMTTPNDSKQKLKKRRWWQFGVRSPNRKMAISPTPIPENPEKETPSIAVFTPIREAPELSVLNNPTQAKSTSAGGGEWFIMKPQGSAEVRRRRSIEQSAREEMKEASKLAAALRKANLMKRRDDDEEVKMQKLEDEADLERARVTSMSSLNRTPLPEEKKRQQFEATIFIRLNDTPEVEEFASTRLVNESLNSELKIQQRSSREIIQREEGESTTDEEQVMTETPDTGDNVKDPDEPVVAVAEEEQKEEVKRVVDSNEPDPADEQTDVSEPLYVEFDQEASPTKKEFDDNLKISPSPKSNSRKKASGSSGGLTSGDDNEDENDLSRSFDEALLQKQFERRLETAEVQRRERELLRTKQRHEDISRAETEERDRLKKETVVLQELEAEKAEEQRLREEFQRRKQEAEKRRRRQDEGRSSRVASTDIDTLLARKREEDKRIEEKIARSRKTSPEPAHLNHEEEWKKMRQAEEIAWLGRKISKTSYPEVTLTKERTAMEVAFEEMNNTFADIGLDGTALHALPEKGEFPTPPPPLPPPPLFDPTLSVVPSSPVGNELDLDLLLADLDEALTLANEKIATGNYEDDVASAWGTRQRPKRPKGQGSGTPGRVSSTGTPQSTMDRRTMDRRTMDRRTMDRLHGGRGTPRSTVDRRTPRDGTPRGSKTATPKISEMRRDLSQLIFEGKHQTESFKKKDKSAKKKKTKKKDPSSGAPATVPVFDDQGQTYPVFLDSDLTVEMMLYRVTSLASREMTPTLSIVESHEDLHIERRLEDHELVKDVIQSWHGSKMSRLILRNTPTKYDLWEKPQLPRNVLIDFCDRKVVPDVSGLLQERDLKKKAWRERMFSLQEDGICGSTVVGSMSKRDLVVVTPLKNHHIYTSFGNNKTNKGPSKFCFFLRPISSTDRKDVVGLCAPDLDTMVTWIAAFRLVKFGMQLKENYSTMRHKFMALSKQQETSALHY